MRFDALAAERAWHRFFVVLCAAILFFLLAPMVVIVPLSFNPEPFFTYPLRGFSLRWYEQFLGSLEWRLAIKNSVIIASATTALATLLGTAAAVGLTLANFRGKGLLIALLLSPMMVPHIIIGLGMFFLYTWMGVIQTLYGMILAHTTIAAPFVLLTVAATLTNFNRNLVRAASGLGAKPLIVFRKVVLPLILPGILAGAVFAFVISFDELIIALFLAGSEHRTLPRQMWSGTREEISPVITAVATVLMGVSIVLVLTMEWLRRRSERVRARSFAA
ncbi:MAG: ABC transporter permease [Alphaproteobacteria bacterium]|nr:ABC transporter permease [Alphaproteobacteria bacterium]